MGRSVAVVRDGELARTEGDTSVVNAASLVKPVVAHVALAVLAELDQPVRDDIRFAMS